MTIKFEWTPEMSVGEDHIDSQHQRLLAQVNKLLEALASEENNNILMFETLNFFDDYIKDHFSYEEDYMRSLNYPYIKPHIEQHNDFIDHYKLFKQRVTAGIEKKLLLMEVEEYIGNWWIEHIGKVDKNYYLFTKGQL